MTRKNTLVLAAALILGVVFIMVMVKLKQPPQRIEAEALVVPVRIVDIVPQVLMTRARGYGQVMPAQSWKAVANVAGRVVWKHPELESGNLIAAGTHLLQIDPSRYELAKGAAQADLAGLEAEQRQLAQAVQSLSNQLSLIPVRRDALAARQARTEANLANAIKDLQDTRFEAPWALRVHQIDVEVGQHVAPGQPLFIVDDIANAEARVQVKLAELRRVLSQLPVKSDPESDRSPHDFIDVHRQLPLAQLDVWVSPTSVPDARWVGRLSRVTSSLDAGTRTVQAVIGVDEPYRNARPPARPPLVRNMFVEVDIAAITPEPFIVVPASAVHQGQVYLADEQDRLQCRDISIGWQQGDLVVIAEGLAAGDRLVLDDLVPAIEGTLLSVQPDEQTRQWLQQAAKGDLP
jgi:RND family efflux transporter MFP subunit